LFETVCTYFFTCASQHFWCSVNAWLPLHTTRIGSSAALVAPTIAGDAQIWQLSDAPCGGAAALAAAAAATGGDAAAVVAAAAAAGAPVVAGAAFAPAPAPRLPPPPPPPPLGEFKLRSASAFCIRTLTPFSSREAVPEPLADAAAASFFARFLTPPLVGMARFCA
jgi:hypothetical protein